MKKCNEIQNYDRGWLKYINLDVLDIYPIQMANCDRLLNNDAVYIFDEVGSGKTISAGLMALDYLYNNNGKVLIITTNSLVRKRQNFQHGQFLRDWYNKLPFRELNLDDRIDITNNNYSHFSKEADYGLIIIDEAQLFLNNESMRYRNLINNYSAEKIIFLTATPIKNSKENLNVYVDMAKQILGKYVPNSWINDINTNAKQKDELICSTFDIKLPVTRYFKDTIMSLNKDGFHKDKARRLLPIIWEYSHLKDKDEILIEKIQLKCNENKNNRFIIFTRFVKKEADKIGKLLLENGFSKYNGSSDNEDRTYDVVTGEDSYKLSNYCGTNHLPKVLIITYQIAEQGVNLPGYNHVINYHISSFPSSLEQRFGRIDRMGKNGTTFREINMCFLISSEIMDSNTWNFYSAINIYLKNLISYLPSKNTILSEEIVNRYSERKLLINEYIAKIKDLINSKKELDLLINVLKQNIDIESNDLNCNLDLYNFVEENFIEFNFNIKYEKSVKILKNDIKNALQEMYFDFEGNSDFPLEKYKEIIKNVSDKIFYSDTNSNLATVDSITECGQNISNNMEFEKYRLEFQEKVKFPILMNNYKQDINSYFEKAFIANNFNILFPFDGYKRTFVNLIKNTHKLNKMNINDQNSIIDNCEEIVKILPFFKMCAEFKSILLNQRFTKKEEIKTKFDYNPFIYSINVLGKKLEYEYSGMGLSTEFLERYLRKKDKKSLLKITFDNTSTVLASNWYKLSYHYTRKEVSCFFYNDLKTTSNKVIISKLYNRCEVENENSIFFYKEKWIRYLGLNYEKYKSECRKYYEECLEYDSAYKVAIDGEGKDYNGESLLNSIGCYPPEEPEIIRQYESCLSDLIKHCDSLRDYDSYQSLFNYYIYRDSGTYRSYINCCPMKCKRKNINCYCKDFWTIGILYELNGTTFSNCSWRNFVELPVGIPEHILKIY